MPTEFTPIASLFGGGLIGLAAVWLMASTGRVAGISGIISRILPPVSSGAGSGLTFIVGLLVAAPVYHLMTGAPPVQTVSDNFLVLAIAGLLVGFGTVLGSGCTSGHGVCGISRLSVRSLIATGTFMATGFATVFIVRYVMGA